MQPKILPKNLLLSRTFQFLIASVFVGSWTFLAYTDELFMRPGGQLPSLASSVLFLGFWLQPGVLWLELLTVPGSFSMHAMTGVQIVSLLANYSLLVLPTRWWPSLGSIIAFCMLCRAFLTLAVAVHSYLIFMSIDWTPPS